MSQLPALPAWRVHEERAHVAWPGAQQAWAAWVPEWPLPEAWWDLVLGADPALKQRRVLWLSVQGAPWGFALLGPGELDPSVGQVDLLALAPEARGQGLGLALGRAALGALEAAGCGRARWGAGLHHAFPGAPEALAGAWPLARALGFVQGRAVHDLQGPTEQPAPHWPEGWSARPCRSEEAEALLAFLSEHFPGRWRRDVGLALAQGMPTEQVVGAFSPEGALLGFAWTHPPSAAGAARWQGLRPGLGAVGPLGLAPQARGGGKGLALVAEALRALAAQGVPRAIIDWTDLVDFYARLGFEPDLSYRQAERPLHPGEAT